jgi:hypothetical protein
VSNVGLGDLLGWNRENLVVGEKIREFEQYEEAKSIPIRDSVTESRGINESAGLPFPQS